MLSRLLLTQQARHHTLSAEERRYEEKSMEGKYSKSLILSLALLSSLAIVAAEDQPILMLGPDGQRLECPFAYEVEQVPEWDSIEGPPPNSR